jgi:DNA-binding response OmpR family regulator
MDKILVVDDDVDLLNIMQLMLIRSGYEVRSLNNGKAVIAILKQDCPDLVILDINLGDADGRQICKDVKSMECFQFLPILLYSAEDRLKIDIADCHADAFVNKPFLRKNF